MNSRTVGGENILQKLGSVVFLIPDNEKIPNCEVSSITYEEKLTQCAPQKIKERIIRFLSEYGLSVEGRQYDIRDFWIVNRYG